MATIQLRNVEKQFGDHTAVKPMNLTIHDGEFVVLLGPSGCGKTTTLRMISGLEAVTRGQILFDDRDVTWLAASDRDIAFVFQFFALYSHMTCRENIAFPLQAARMPRAEINAAVASVAELLQIERILDLKPGGLSGGDQQRVALARALVRRPAAFLMDEPLGALDAEFRETMRAEIKQLHVDQGATTVYVTHDQVEAMAMGDKIVVMSAAEIQQAGTPTEVYEDPANLFVAKFIGSPGMNLLEGRYVDGVVQLPGIGAYPVADDWRATLNLDIGDDQPMTMGFRPEAATLTPDGPLTATVFEKDLYGGYMMMILQVGERSELIVEARVSRREAADYNVGDAVRFDVDPARVRFFDPSTELAVRKREEGVPV